ncbi:hypothetical protein K1719_017527 [Acacia pycnantha]|nr:hypothetical protein K1719_017527 [Acacia pycnantha]
MEEKSGASPLSEESLRSTKKVRIREDGEVGGGHGDLGGSDVVMADEGANGAVSYRAKLLNLTQTGKEQQTTGEVVVTEKDYLISRDGNMPVIEFSKEVRAVLVQGSYQLVDMEGGFYFASFDLEEDYMKVLTGGPWMVFGLSFRYYHKSTLRAIGKLLGDVVKLDYTTKTSGRGRYARIAVIVDLQNPLIPWIKVDGRTYGIEYECLPLICFECGKYGHTKERCGGGTLSRAEGTPLTPATPAQPASPIAGDKAGSGSSPFGSWMQEDSAQPSGENKGNVNSHEGPVKINTPHARVDGVSKPLDGVGVDGHDINECPKEHEGERCSEVAIKEETLTVVRMESTLDQSKHTVVELHQQRHTLEEVQHPNTDNIMGEILGSSVHEGIGMGKENLGKSSREKGQAQHGVKLHSPILHKMKVRKKQSGAQISRDAKTLIQSDFETYRIGVGESGCLKDPVMMLPECDEAFSEARLGI